MTGKNKFQIGDKVTIREDSQFFEEGPSDSHCQLPLGVVGTVTEQGARDWVSVNWNGGGNSYQEHDLDLAEATEDFRLT